MAGTLKNRNLRRNDAASVADAISSSGIANEGASIAIVPPNQPIFTQGEPCDDLYYLHAGTAKLHVLSKSGREAIIVILVPGDFFGEGCMLDNARRIATVTAMTACTIERIGVAEVWRRLRSDSAFARKFMDFLVTRNRQYLAGVSADFGLSNGLAFPIPESQGPVGFVWIAGAPADTVESEMPILHLMALYAFDRVRRLRGMACDPMPLTPREREVLTWVARGKSAWEIGEILAIAKRTVDEHVQKTCRKLNAANRTQAVAVALRERLIAL